MSEKKLINLEKDSLDTESIIEELLKNVPKQDKEAVILPGGDEIYNITTKDKRVYVRPINFEDEKVIASIKNPKKMLDTLLMRCVEGVDIDELLPKDKIYLVVKLRSISVGPTYSFNITCTNPACGEVSIVDTNLDEDFRVKMADPPITPTVKFTLPIAKQEVEVRRLRSKDITGDGTEVLTQLWRFIISIGGQTNRSVISKVIEKLPRKDIYAIVEKVTPSDYGIETDFIFKCPKCDHEFLTRLSLDENFFSER